MGRELFFLLFAGVPAEDTGGFPLYPLGRWLFPIGICLLAAGFRMERNRASRLFAVIRYGKREKWWTAHFCGNLLYGVLTGAALLASGLLLQHLITGRPDRQDMEAMAAVCILWMAHMMTLLALFLFAELFMKTVEQRNLIPPALLLLEGMSFLYGHYHREAARFMFGSWGMYTQSGLCEGGYGYRAVPVLAVEAACIAGCCLLGYGFLAGRGKETDDLWQV